MSELSIDDSDGAHAVACSEAHARLIKHFIASHGRPGRSFFEVYTWGATLADQMIEGFGFADRRTFEAMRKFSLSLEGKPTMHVVDARSTRETAR